MPKTTFPQKPVHRHIPITTTLDTMRRMTDEQLVTIDSLAQMYKRAQTARVFTDPFIMGINYWQNEQKFPYRIEVVLEDDDSTEIFRGTIDTDGGINT